MRENYSSAPFGASFLRLSSHGLCRGLHSCAASRLKTEVLLHQDSTNLPRCLVLTHTPEPFRRLYAALRRASRNLSSHVTQVCTFRFPHVIVEGHGNFWGAQAESYQARIPRVGSAAGTAGSGI